MNQRSGVLGPASEAARRGGSNDGRELSALLCPRARVGPRAGSRAMTPFFRFLSCCTPRLGELGRKHIACRGRHTAAEGHTNFTFDRRHLPSGRFLVISRGLTDATPSTDHLLDARLPAQQLPRRVVINRIVDRPRATPLYANTYLP